MSWEQGANDTPETNKQTTLRASGAEGNLKTQWAKHLLAANRQWGMSEQRWFTLQSRNRCVRRVSQGETPGRVFDTTPPCFKGA